MTPRSARSGGQLAVAGLLGGLLLITGVPAIGAQIYQVPPDGPPIDNPVPPDPVPVDPVPAGPPTGEGTPPVATDPLDGGHDQTHPHPEVGADTPSVAPDHGADIVVGSGMPGDPLTLHVDPIEDLAAWTGQQTLLYELEQTHNQPFSIVANDTFSAPLTDFDPHTAQVSQAAANPITAVLLTQATQAWQAAEPDDEGEPERIPPATGPVTTETVRGIEVAAHIADNVEAMLAAAEADGVHLTGWGYRSTERQIELRQQHCGSSDYAIYEMPSSQCSPPTATPGNSMHERGEAIDFSNCPRGSDCFAWLSENAASYGFYNLPSESWHWSVNGR